MDAIPTTYFICLRFVLLNNRISMQVEFIHVEHVSTAFSTGQRTIKIISKWAAKLALETIDHKWILNVTYGRVICDVQCLRIRDLRLASIIVTEGTPASRWLQNRLQRSERMKILPDESNWKKVKYPTLE